MRSFVVVVVLAALIAACSSGPGGSAGGGGATARASGGQASVAVGGADLTGRAWQWTVSFTKKIPRTITQVPDPSKYTIEFKGDGTFTVKAVCNDLSGTYKTAAGAGGPEGAGLTITFDPEEVSPCNAADPRPIGFVDELQKAQAYVIAGDKLKLTVHTETKEVEFK